MNVLPAFAWIAIGGSLMFGFLWRAKPEFVRDAGRWFQSEFLGARRTRCGERNASTSLKTITSAQADFRSNDRDGDGENGYWRGDIAGLYAVAPIQDSTGQPIKLIELGLAAADARPVTKIEKYTVRGPKAGYWFRALLHAGEKDPSPDRFAACAYPERYQPSDFRWTYIVDENNKVYRKDLGRAGGISVYPSDPTAEGWQKLD